jgi:putative drug exporter of the RND superfamily
MPHVPGACQHSQPPPGDRLATALRWARWPVVIAWVLAAVLLYSFAGHLSRVTNDSAAANLPSSAQSTQVVGLQQSARTGQLQSGQNQAKTDQVVVVFARGNGRLTRTDLAGAAAARAATGRLAGHVAGLGEPGPLERSADGRAVTFQAPVTAPASSQTSADTAAVRAIRAAVGTGADGLQAAVTGSAATTADSGAGSQTTLLLTAVVIVAVILLLVYRSPLLWILPLLSAFGAIITAKAAAHAEASAGVTVSSLSTSILIVLVFGAATDYALLLIHRYREELRRHARTEQAMAAALRRTLPTLAASAATVTCAMLCLLAAQSASLHGLGPVGAVSIASALLAQTTLLPALLLITGRAVFWPLMPRQRQPGHEQSRLLAGLGARVARRPAWAAVAVACVLAGACAGLAALHTDNNPQDQAKGHPGSVTGEQLLIEHHEAGVIAPLTLLAPPREARAAASAARATPGVASVSPDTPAGGYASFSVTLSADPYSASGYAAVQNLRGRLAGDAPGSLVGGSAAVQYDIIQASNHDTLVLIPLILAVIFLIILMLLRAVIAPLLLVAATALNFAASLGLSTLLWRYGLGYGGMEAQIRMYIFVFLAALGVDYSIFLSARIREEARHLGTRDGILRGLSVTGGVITAAGIVLAGTFAALTQLPSVPITQIGIAVAAGVLLDTLLVLTVLIPASLLATGDRAWWPARTARRRQHARPAPAPQPAPAEHQQHP